MTERHSAMQISFFRNKLMWFFAGNYIAVLEKLVLDCLARACRKFGRKIERGSRRERKLPLPARAFVALPVLWSQP